MSAAHPVVKIRRKCSPDRLQECGKRWLEGKASLSLKVWDVTLELPATYITVCACRTGEALSL